MNDRFSADDLPRKGGSAARPSPWPIDLAHVRPFRVGDVDVTPAEREVRRGDQCEVLEPLVMQVLVALSSAGGAVLSRDDLIDACWGGRAVTDDAVNRVLSALRALGRKFGSFKIETITKVGYRLVEDGAGTQLRPIDPVRTRHGHGADDRSIDRRKLIVGGAAIAAAVGGTILWKQQGQHRPSIEARDLFERGEIAQRQGFAGQERQAVSFYERAVRIDPLYADAWAALALSNTHLLEGYGEAEIQNVSTRLQSAARRALQLDPGNADAELALVLVKPVYRNWARLERELLSFIGRHPGHWLAPGRLAVLLFDVGRLRDGIAILTKALKSEPMLPVGQAYLANAMLSAGMLQEADAVLDKGQEQWPAHPSLWATRLKSLLFSGRPQAAAAFAIDPDARPSGVTPDDVAPFIRLARGLDSRKPNELATSVREFRVRAEADVQNIPFSAAAFALLSRPDLAFAAWERYFLNQGIFGPSRPIGPQSRRYARELFSLPMTGLFTDSRFALLLRKTGLENYWRQTGTQPDFRRG